MPAVLHAASRSFPISARYHSRSTHPAEQRRAIPRFIPQQHPHNRDSVVKKPPVALVTLSFRLLAGCTSSAARAGGRLLSALLPHGVAEHSQSRKPRYDNSSHCLLTTSKVRLDKRFLIDILFPRRNRQKTASPSLNCARSVG